SESCTSVPPLFASTFRRNALKELALVTTQLRVSLRFAAVKNPLFVAHTVQLAPSLLPSNLQFFGSRLGKSFPAVSAYTRMAAEFEAAAPTNPVLAKVSHFVVLRPSKALSAVSLLAAFSPLL